ncbi:hypothetical protein [Cupriavidus plantarum]|uniref:hypothetical protein n=1 Tax=Cupriavidus plantarum TaxID=942865 RepID=UPI000EAC9AFF|nr:hypothetical protein [Cupriavidus plantarum]RLK36113.1 hypothetical protein C7417_3888 [Cupriavidus plantarum]
MRLVITLAIASLLSGCSAIRSAKMEAAARQKEDVCKQRRDEMNARNKQTIDTFLVGKSFAEKLPVAGRKVSFEMLNNKTLPTPSESEDLLQYRDLRSKILTDATGWWMDCAPKEVSTAFFESSRESIEVGRDLAMGRMTFGQAAERLDQISQTYDARLPVLLQQARTREQDEWNQRAATQAARDQAAAANFAASMAAMPKPQTVHIQPPAPIQMPAYRAPTQTNCTRWGSQVNCTTY